MLSESNKDRLKTLTRGVIRFDEPMRNHTSFRIGGPADALIMPADEDDLRNVMKFANENGIPWEIMGNGTNLLVSNEGVDGIVIKIKDCLDSVAISEQRVIVGAGYLLTKLSRLVADHGLSGLEFAVGIPGTLGGATVMNAGAHGGQMSDVVTNLTVMDRKGGVSTSAKKELDYGYRESKLQSLDLIVLEVELELKKGKPADIKQKMAEFLKWRRKSQPLGLPNAGSIFKNPENDYAGRLIELSGCKGMMRGDAQVSDLHANFIINKGNATARDVMNLITQVHRNVLEQADVDLGLEIKIIGRWRDDVCNQKEKRAIKWQTKSC